MAFNFWEAQRRARTTTKWYLLAFLLMTAATAVAVEWAMRALAGPDNYSPPFPIVGFIFAAITLGTALFNYGMYKQHGGSYVAEAAGGVLVQPQTRDPHERQLLNIVREISIASALPMPAVYIIPAKEINAFAAGLTQDNAAIAVTEGCLAYLNREELQGVIAHEFGHIYNRDMRIGLQLAAMVMGFFVLLYLGFRLIQIASLTSDRREDSGDRKGMNPFLLAGLLFVVAGAVTWFFGAILQSAVSRQREYLADACSVQFTRYPEGIANALRKIGKQTASDMPRSGMAFSHLYFDERGGFAALFATHPPLEDRIAAIEGLNYMPPEWKEGLLKKEAVQDVK